jgi:hypothetical protein
MITLEKLYDLELETKATFLTFLSNSKWWRPEKFTLFSNRHRGYFTCSINWNDEKPQINNDNIFDLLGRYKSQDSHWEEEGRIIMYPNAIWEYAEKLIKSQGKNVPVEELFNKLTRIILIHELSHWVFHWLPCDSIHGEIQRNKFYKSFNTELHEFVAQYFTWTAITENASFKLLGLQDIFLEMCKDQSSVYRLYENAKGIDYEVVFFATANIRHEKFTFKDYEWLLNDPINSKDKILAKDLGLI